MGVDLSGFRFPYWRFLKGGGGGGGVLIPFPSPVFFEIPLPIDQILFPPAISGKKSQCYTYDLYSLRILKITTSKYDPTKTPKFTRIYKDVLKTREPF